MADPGWLWTEEPVPTEAEDQLAAACARLFASADGQLLLTHLTRFTLAVSPGPEVTEARLRHLEGQRTLVLTLRHLAARGGLSPLPSI